MINFISGFVWSLMKKWMKGGEDGVWEALDKQTIADVVLCYGIFIYMYIHMCVYMVIYIYILLYICIYVYMCICRRLSFYVLCHGVYVMLQKVFVWMSFADS